MGELQTSYGSRISALLDTELESLDIEFPFPTKKNGRNIFEFSIKEKAGMTREAAELHKKCLNQKRSDSTGSPWNSQSRPMPIPEPKDRTNLRYFLLILGIIFIFYLLPKFVSFIIPFAFKNDYSKIKQF